MTDSSSSHWHRQWNLRSMPAALEILKRQVRNDWPATLHDEDVQAIASVIWCTHRPLRCAPSSILWHLRVVKSDALASCVSPETVGAISSAELAASKRVQADYDGRRSQEDPRDPVMYAVVTVLTPPVPMSNPEPHSARLALEQGSAAGTAIDVQDLATALSDVTSENYPGDHRVASSSLLPIMPLLRNDGSGLFTALPWQIVLRSKVLLDLRSAELEQAARPRRNRSGSFGESYRRARSRFNPWQWLTAADHPSCSADRDEMEAEKPHTDGK